MAVAADATDSTQVLQTRWVLASVPSKSADGGYPVPKLTDYKAIREPAPTAADIKDGEVLIKHHFLSPDPYVLAFKTKEEHVGKTVWAGAAGEVIASKSDKFTTGDIVYGGGACGSREYSVHKATYVQKVLFDTTKVSLSLSLGLLGMPGVTAFLAVNELLGKDLSGKTVVVTGSAGAVGSAAGQIAKQLGAAKVIGICGSDDKIKRCQSKFQYDHCLNYKSPTLAKELRELSPFDLFFDNTGGPAADHVKALMVDGGKVAKVGSIGGPVSNEHDHRLVVKWFMVYSDARVPLWPNAIKTMAEWVVAGKLHYEETVLHGIDSLPTSFVHQRTGKNTGKMIVDLTSGFSKSITAAKGDKGKITQGVTNSVVTLNTGAAIPRVALGVYQTKVGGETYEAVKAALAVGYRHIDTAALYRNEESVGKAVRDSGIARSDIFITTKLWSLSLDKSKDVDAFKFVKDEAEKSLARLGTYADLYLVHSPHNPEHRLDMWRAMSALVDEGKVKAVGVSNYGVHHIQEILEAGLRVPAVNQIEIHPFLRRDKIAAFCEKNNILVEAYSPLAKARKFGHSVLVSLASKHGKSEAQIMIRWSLQKGYVTLPKSANPVRIKSNSEVFDFSLDESDMKLLDGLDAHLTTGWDPTTLS